MHPDAGLFHPNKNFGVDISRYEGNNSCPEDHFGDSGFSVLPGRASTAGVVTSEALVPARLVSK
jgi:hypothetical protein